MSPSWPCLGERGSARCLLLLAVSPNARRTVADGLHDGCLRVRLAAPPVDGKANEALVAWLADELGLPRRAVRLLRGEASRRKQVEVDAPAERVGAWLASRLDAAQ
ncbi:MAG: DUF167 domain-containing protein [Burkholderiales bacterium]|nr:DUF167 domain-containing protein [Burkholderiales bacterium]MDE1926391.1 DUF167 domain-containing protein [Burkholderiales bacterium]MDE2157344.1 DUF167 domain-containing protein [Burkholderiales bacterium]MDE2504077.1 DUF167 domain-containing protein [Burkholderiales bacterium]